MTTADSSSVAPKKLSWFWILSGLIVIVGIGLEINDQITFYRQHPDVKVSDYPIAASSTAKPDAIAYISSVSRIMQPCMDAGQSQLVAEAGTDAVSNYQAAKLTASICDVDQKFDNVVVPKSVGRETATKIGRALALCQLSMTTWALSASYLADGLAVNGDVSKLAEARNNEAMAARYLAACRAEMINVTKPFGVSPEEITLQG